MPEYDFELSHFFAWARSKAYAEFERRLQSDPSLDPNWLFSDIMQELLDKYRALPVEQRSADFADPPSFPANE